MSSLWLVPVNEPDFQKTLAQPIDLSDWEDRPDDFPEESRIWGVRADPQQGEWKVNRRHLENMEPNDTLLFYRSSESRYDAAGTIGQFARTEYVRTKYWDGGPSIDIYTVENYNDTVTMSSKQVNEILDYKKGYHPQGLSAVGSQSAADRLIRRLNIGTAEP